MLADRGNTPADPSSAPAQPKILIVGTDTAACERIVGMLRSTWAKGLDAVRSDDLADAARELVKDEPTCILLDLSSFESDPLAAVDQLGGTAPNVPILVLADEENEEQALTAVRAGAQDYLIKSELYPTLLCRAVKYAIERKRAEVKLAYQAMHDSLTGLPNRALFLDRLSVAIDRARRTDTAIAVLFLDVDNFKEINDQLGHDAGDRVLVALADRLRTLLRPMDTVARFGGDEFTFLIEELTDEREVVLIADRITRAASLPIPLGQVRATISVSIGIAMVSGPAVSPETLIREADAAMYRVKEHGRGGYELFDEPSRRRALQRLELEDALRGALEHSELRLHYQPGVALGRGSRLESLEALVRWDHPEHGLMPPERFIPLAEQTGLVIRIGRYVLEHALSQLSEWRRQIPSLTLSVNLSARELDDLNLVSTLAAALRSASVEPDAVCLEIEESAIGNDPDSTLVAMQGLKATGVRLAIDNFGASASSLASLKLLPVDTIKLHRSLVSGLGTHPRETPIIAAVVELGHALGLNVVAEGVETETQADELRSIGCDSAQGFLFGSPIPEEEVSELLIEAGEIEIRPAGPADPTEMPISAEVPDSAEVPAPSREPEITSNP